MSSSVRRCASSSSDAPSVISRRVTPPRRRRRSWRSTISSCVRPPSSSSSSSASRDSRMTADSRIALPGEELAEMRAHDLFERHERRRLGDLDQTREAGRDLHEGEAAGRLGRALEAQHEIDAQRREQGERARRVHRQRRQHRQHVLAEERAELNLLGRIHLAPGHEADARAGERGHELGAHEVIERLHLRVRALADGGQLLRRREPRRVGGHLAVADRMADQRDAHHEKLVEIRRDDRRELDALEQRVGRVCRFLEHALVERQPRELAVDEVLRQA